MANESTFKNITNFLKSDAHYYDYIIPRLKTSIFQISARREVLKGQFEKLFNI